MNSKQYPYRAARSDTSPTPATQRWVLVLGAIASCMAALDTLVVATALSTIRRDLGATIDTLEWTVNAYNLSFAVLLMTAAALGDRFGRTRMFALGLGIFAVASAACALSTSVAMLIAARAVQGAGAALLMSLALALVGAAFPEKGRGRAMGIVQGATGLATACGPLIGGTVAQGMAWQWIFWINVPIGLIAIPLVLNRIPESRGPDSALDLPGLALITGGATGIVWALVRGDITGWASIEVVVSAIAGLALLIAFGWWEARCPEPMLPLALFTSRGFSVGNSAIFLAFAALFTSVFFYAQFLQTVLGYDPLATGLRLLPWTMILFFCAPIAGVLADRFGERTILGIGLVSMAIGMLWIASVAEARMAYHSLVIPLILSGIGTSLAIPSAQSSVVGAVPQSAIGKAAGANSMMRELGGVFGIAIAAAVFAGFGGYGSPDEFVTGFKPAVTVGAALALLGALTALALPGRRNRDLPLSEATFVR